jgi:cytidylate kinase
MPAAGKTTLARALALRFGVPHYGGGDMLREIAKERGYNPTGDGWWDTEEGMQFLSERHSEPDFDREADARLLRLVEKRNVIITSYTLPWLAHDGVKFWLKASAERRARRMAQRDDAPVDLAERTIAERDRKNRELYAKLYGIHFGEDLSVFDFVINTDHLNEDDVTEVATVIISRLSSGEGDGNSRRYS